MPPPAPQAEGAWLDDTAAAELDYKAEDFEQLQQQLTHWLTHTDVSLAGFAGHSRPEGREAIILKVVRRSQRL